ncbi:unnamed protein product [Soboliphyme baturini]|uniref:Uncharacterized protein n=1 Tax=Soboliphyme baturini TaxID=241478 RepID=A0A183J0S3_9BILA|nr:unnamed protein product [Soboliphyme baturini]
MTPPQALRHCWLRRKLPRPLDGGNNNVNLNGNVKLAPVGSGDARRMAADGAAANHHLNNDWSINVDSSISRLRLPLI